MYEVRNHVVALAVDLFLTRLVKVKLHQLVLLVTDGDGAARLVVDLNGMPVIDDLELRRLVAEFDARKIRFLHTLVTDIDRRLGSAYAASVVVLLQRCPVRGTARSRVAPMRCVVRGRYRETRHQRDASADDDQSDTS